MINCNENKAEKKKKKDRSHRFGGINRSRPRNGRK